MVHYGVRFLNEITLFTGGKKRRSIGELNQRGWINNRAFLVDMTNHFHNLIKQLQGTDKLITETSSSSMALQSNADLHPLMDFSHSALLFDLYLQFVILY